MKVTQVWVPRVPDQPGVYLVVEGHDNMENHNPQFADWYVLDPNRNISEQVCEIFKAHPIETYRGYDKKMYPRNPKIVEVRNL